MPQTVRMNDYERIAKVITWLDDHFTDQPDLDALAKVAGLSRHHFHRLFTNWAGTTPKAFLQCLTLNYAKERLRRGESVLDSALDSGLSGPGRLHDLCVNLEAASPGEVKSGGEGLTIEYGVADTPFGPWLVGQSQRGIVHISFLDSVTKGKEVPMLIQRDWPAAHLHERDRVAQELSQQIFASKQRTEPMPIRAYVHGTSFQLRVWRALLEIPPGSLISYRHLAGICESPNAARAVGTAVGSNPLAWLIPCHRVIRSTGVISQYRWGPTRKKIIIGYEGISD